MTTTYNVNQLTQYADKFLKDNYNLQMNVPLKLNGRMRTTCGWFKHTEEESLEVELNKFFVENNEPNIVLDVLRHELVHYALFEQGKPNADGHPVFEGELKRLGIVSQSTIDKYTITSKPRKEIIYKCESCGYEFHRMRALPHGGRYSRCSCGGCLENLGKRIIK